MAGNKFDEVLLSVGPLGLFQKRLIFIMCITSMCVFMQNSSPVFTMKIPIHRCRIPGLDNDTYEIQNSHHAQLVNLTIPLDSKGQYSSCTVYDVSGYQGYENRTTIECDDWVYDKSVFEATYVTELNLVCSRTEYRSHSTMMIFAGKFLGAFLTSVFGDYFGRRRVYVVMMLAMALAGLLLVLVVPNVTALMALRLFAGAATTGAYLPPLIIALELVGNQYRGMVGYINSAATIAAAFTSVTCAYFFRHWQSFQISLVAPNVLMLVAYFYLPESPRWLASRGRNEEAKEVLERVAVTNGVVVSPVLLREALPEPGEKTEGEMKPRETPFQMFRIPRLFVRYSLLYLSWILVVMSYYGLQLNVTNMSGDIFLNYAIMSATDVMATVVFALMVDRVGRRPLLLLAGVVSGVACLATALPAALGGSTWIIRGLSFVGKTGISVGFGTLYILSPELFPTVLRSFGLGSCSMFSRLGGLASPYVADLSLYVSGTWAPVLPQLVFGASGVLSAIMTFFLPETKGRNLPETIRDAQNFGRTSSGNTEGKDGVMSTEFTVPEDSKMSNVVSGNTDDLTALQDKPAIASSCSTTNEPSTNSNNQVYRL